MNPNRESSQELHVQYSRLSRRELVLLDTRNVKTEQQCNCFRKHYWNVNLPVYFLMFCRARMSLLYSSSFALHSLKLCLISWSHNSCRASSDRNLMHKASKDWWDIPTTCNHCFTAGKFFTSGGSSSEGILALATSCLLKSLTSFPFDVKPKQLWAEHIIMW